jgi:hypothetical protein
VYRVSRRGSPFPRQLDVNAVLRILQGKEVDKDMIAKRELFTYGIVYHANMKGPDNM